MHEGNAGISRMLANYQELLWRFAVGDVSAEAFATEFLTRFKNDPNQVTGKEFEVLDELFADVDDYVSDPILRKNTGGIGGEELRQRARDAYARLYGDHL